MFRKGATVYISNVVDFNQSIKKATLIEPYVNEDEAGDKATTWVVQYKHRGGLYHNMAYEAHMTMDSTEYEKIEKRVILQDKIDILQKELKELR